MNSEPTDASEPSADLPETARRLAEADLARAHPDEIPALLHDLHASVDVLKHTTAELSWWHSRAIRGSDYAPDEHASEAIEDAATQLLAASRFLTAARDATAAAVDASENIRWRRRDQKRSPSTRT